MKVTVDREVQGGGGQGGDFVKQGLGSKMRRGGPLRRHWGPFKFYGQGRGCGALGGAKSGKPSKAKRKTGLFWPVLVKKM